MTRFVFCLALPLSVLFCCVANAQSQSTSDAQWNGYLWARGMRLEAETYGSPAPTRRSEGSSSSGGFYGVPFPDYRAQAAAAGAEADAIGLRQEIAILEKRVASYKKSNDELLKSNRRLKTASWQKGVEMPATEAEWAKEWEKRMKALLEKPTPQTAQDFLDWVFVDREKDKRPKMAVISLEE